MMLTQKAAYAAHLSCTLFVALHIASAQSLYITPTSIAAFTGSAGSLDVRGINRIVVGTIDGSKVPFRFAGIQDVDCRGCGDVQPPDFVVVSPASGTTPAAVWIALNPKVVPYLPAGPITFSAVFVKPGESCPSCARARMVLNLTGYVPSVTAVVNSATLQPGAIAPGEIVSILGDHLGTPPVSSQFDSSGFFPTTLGNSRVTFNGVPAALLYVSANQINTLVPFSMAGQRTASIVVTHDATSSAAVLVPVEDTAPGIFTATGTGTGQGAILNYNGGVNSTTNPVEKGSAITLFGTGSGLWSNGAGIWSDAVPDGAIFVTATGPPAAPVSLTIGGQPARLLYAGGAPFQSSGMIQVNAIVPQNIGSGAQPVVLKIGERDNAAQKVTVAVQ